MGVVSGLIFFIIGMVLIVELQDTENFARTWMVAQIVKEFLWFIPVGILWYLYYER
jgi:glycopeptide antibiotics resistance protein